MIFIDQHDGSIWNKSVFSSSLFITLLLTLWMMFAGDGAPGSWLRQHRLTGDPLRQTLMAVCIIIYFLRLQITVWVFQKRKWTWLETILITALMSFVLYAFARACEYYRHVVGFVEVMGIMVYLSGSYINTHSEYYRHLWKLKKENKGRLYTKGLFRLSMHINYLGDIILFTGMAMVTHSLGIFVIPLIMTLNFIFNIIPSLDRYLEKKYGDEFRNYAQKTKKLIPMLY